MSLLWGSRTAELDPARRDGNRNETRYTFGVELKNASTAAQAMQSFDSLADYVINAPKVKK